MHPVHTTMSVATVKADVSVECKSTVIATLRAAEMKVQIWRIYPNSKVVVSLSISSTPRYSALKVSQYKWQGCEGAVPHTSTSPAKMF